MIVPFYLNLWPPSSPDVDIQYIGGADPVMVFLDKDYKEVEVRPSQNTSGVYVVEPLYGGHCIKQPPLYYSH